MLPGRGLGLSLLIRNLIKTHLFLWYRFFFFFFFHYLNFDFIWIYPAWFVIFWWHNQYLFNLTNQRWAKPFHVAEGGPGNLTCFLCRCWDLPSTKLIYFLKSIRAGFCGYCTNIDCCCFYWFCCSLNYWCFVALLYYFWRSRRYTLCCFLYARF